MNILTMQYEQNGEWFAIWETEQNDLQKAFDEIDSDVKPACGGYIKFQNDTGFLVVNGGFDTKQNYDNYIDSDWLLY